MDDIQLMTEVGGTGDRKESILLTNLNIVGAIWDTNTNTLVELQPDAKTFNRYYRGVGYQTWKEGDNGLLITLVPEVL